MGVVALLLPILSGAQSPPIKPLAIGDTLPDITITNVYNYPSSTVHFSDLKGKLVILDFWATWCGSCINAFPKMEKLQARFPDELQVLLVNAASTNDDFQKVNALFKRKEVLTGYKTGLPYILEEEQLASFFPYRYLPHYVWVDTNRVVIAITGSEEVTESNIRKVLEGSSVSFHTKSDDFVFDRNKPLFVAGNGGGDSSFKYRSVMSGYIEGLGSSSGSSVIDSSRVRIYGINTPVFTLMAAAFQKEMDLPRNRILFEGQNAKILDVSSGADPRKALICYELIIPTTSSKHLAQYYKEDIQRYLQLTVVRRKQPSECFILTLRKSENDTNSSNGKMDVRLNEEYLKNHIRNASASSVADYISPFFKIPVIDETNSTQLVSISFEKLDEASIIKSLHKAGFNMSKGIRDLEFAVITDYPSEP